MFSILKEQINHWISIPTDELELVPETSSHAEEKLHNTNENDLNTDDAPKEEEDSEVGSQVVVKEVGRNRDEVEDISLENLQIKAFTHAKLFGNYLYSTVTEIGTQLKKTIKEFNKAQDAFVKELADKHTFSALAPWVGSTNEDKVKEVCLSLSSDRRNFFRNPPEGVDFEFDYESMYPVATAIMEYDANLIKMRYELVPKLINEEHFWRNYFYRVYLVCQANGASFIPKSSTQMDMPAEEESLSEAEDVCPIKENIKTSTNSKQDIWEEELEAELQDYESTDNEKIETIIEDSEEFKTC